VDAALDVLAEHGVAGSTHRRVASRADVPLGSVTYHFATLRELLAEAFCRHAERQTVRFAQRFDHVASRDQLVEALVELVVDLSGARRRDAVVSFELYLAAARDPALRAVTQAWTRDSRAVLARFLDPGSAAALDALLEGLIMHSLLSTGAATPEQTRLAIAHALPPQAAAPGAAGS